MKELKGDIIQRFGSSGLHKSETTTNAVSTFHLEVATRGPTALEMYEAFSTFAANSVMHLIGVHSRKTGYLSRPWPNNWPTSRTDDVEAIIPQ